MALIPKIELKICALFCLTIAHNSFDSENFLSMETNVSYFHDKNELFLFLMKRDGHSHAVWRCSSQQNERCIGITEIALELLENVYLLKQTASSRALKKLLITAV